MASASHPFQAHQSNDGGQPPPLQGYGSPLPQTGVPYGAASGVPPLNASYGYGAPQPYAGYGYINAPQPHAGYGYNGAPSPNVGYSNGAPPANTGYFMDALGNIDGQKSTSLYAPNPAANTVGASGYPNGGAPSYPNAGAPGYPAPGYPNGGAPQGYPNGGAPQGYPAPGYLNGGAPQGYPNDGAPCYPAGVAPGSTVYPNKAPGYPVGAPALSYGYGAPGAVHPVGAYYPPGGGAPGYTGFADGQPPPSHQPPVDPRNQIQMGRWAAGLCSCCDNCVPNLLMSWCCPFIPLAQIYARLGLLQFKTALIRFCFLYVFGLIGNFFGSSRGRSSSYNSTSVYDDGSASSSPVALIFSLLMTAGQLIFRVVVWQVRSKVRQRFQIPGSWLGDGCASCCCSCCAIAQLATHVKSYTPGDCSINGPDVLPPFIN